MRTRRRTDSHLGCSDAVPVPPSGATAVRSPAGWLVAPSVSVMMALGGVWAPSPAGAAGPPDGRATAQSPAPAGSPEGDAPWPRSPASRGPKAVDGSCSRDESPEQDTSDRPAHHRRLGDRQRPAATVHTAAGSGRDWRDCPDGQPRGPASGGDVNAEDHRAGAGASGRPQSGDHRSDDQRPAAVSHTSQGPGTSRPDAGSGAGRRADSKSSTSSSWAADDSGSQTGDDGSSRSAPVSDDTNAGGASGGGMSDRPGNSARAGGRGKGGARRSPGGGGSSRGPSGGGTFGGGRGYGSGSSGGGAGSGGPSGFRIAPGGPPAPRHGQGGADAFPGTISRFFIAPGAALMSSPGIGIPAVLLPVSAGTAAAAASRPATLPAAVGGPAGPIARTGRESSASAMLAIVLILVGGALRRTGRSRARSLVSGRPG